MLRSQTVAGACAVVTVGVAGIDTHINAPRRNARLIQRRAASIPWTSLYAFSHPRFPLNVAGVADRQLLTAANERLNEQQRFVRENLQPAVGAVSSRTKSQLKEPTTATKISYLKETRWSQEKLLFGKNKIAALTFCNVPIALP